MEVRSPRVQEWGAVAWGLVAAALLIGGILESLMTGRIMRVQHSGVRNSTDALLQPVVGPANATDEVRRLLQRSTTPGPIAILYSKEFDHFGEPAMAISVLAWPSEAWLIPWDGSEIARSRLALTTEGRRFFVGPPSLIPGYRSEQQGPQLWSIKREDER